MTVPRWDALRDDLAELHRAALEAADPGVAVTRALAAASEGIRIDGELVPVSSCGRLWLVAAGKASIAMTAAAVAVLGDRLHGGVVAHPRYADPPAWAPAGEGPGLRSFASGHPLPDESSLAAGAAVTHLAASAVAEDLILVLLSGGASALLEDLPRGLSLDVLRRTTLALQHAGASVAELNFVRRNLSRLKGGGLARLAAPARVVTLALSDVVGDRPEAIGSGPTVPGGGSAAQAMAALERAGVAAQFPEVVAILAGASGEPRAGPPPSGLYRIVASNRDAAEAVARCAARRGFRSQIASVALEGEAREAGRVIGGCASSVALHGLPFGPPACIVFGGECTVTVRGGGRGGRNQELALGAALALDGAPRAAVFSFATDGVDGASSAAGAIATGESAARAAARGLSIPRALADNDSESLLRELGDLWESGPTGTNVNDLAVALIYP